MAGKMPEVLTYICPFCGCEVRVGGTCPGCVKKRKPAAVAKKRSWEQGHGGDGLDLPEEDFDYDAFVAREFGGKPHRATGVRWYWWLLGVLMLVVMALWAIL